MVRAQKRKKAPVIPFTKGEQGAKIEWEAFDALKKRHKISEDAANCDGVDSVHGIVQRMLGDMENQPSTAQIKVVQEMKGKLRVAMQKLLTNTDIINDEILYALAAMLRLYLQPQSFPIRKATEWIIESLKFFEQRSGQQVAVCMQCVCKDFVREYGEWKTALDKSSIPLETCMNWALTFNSIAYLNKELPFLMVKSADAHDDSLVTIVVESVMILFDMLAVHVVEAASSVIAMRFAECCAECLKVTSSLCKVVVSEGKTVIHRIDSAVIDRSISLCTILLPSDLINKDVQSAIATALASLLHLRAVTNFSSEWEKELREIMHCAEVMCLLPDGVLRSVAEQALSLFGMSDELCCALAATTAEGRLLFLRGLLVVLPEETILAPGVTLAASSERSDVEAQIGRGTVVWESDCLFFSPCIFALTTHCSQSNASLCLTSCQLIETWMSRAAMLSRTDAIIGPRLVCNVINIAGVLIDTWNHSSKQVAHIVYTLFEKALSLIQELSKFDGTNVVSVWDGLVDMALAQPTHFRGRYQALSCLLQRAAGDATPNRILRLRPTFIRELVGIIVLSRDVSSAACSLLIEFIRSLSPTDPSLVRNQWVPEVAQRLCSAVQNERVNVTDYLLPEIVVKLDSACLPSLMLEIHKQRPQLPPTGVLWGLCSAVMHARLQSLPGAVISSTGSSHDTLALKDLLSACTSDDADLRLLALSIPVLSQKTVTPISSSDMSVFKFAFVYSLKSSLPDHRHKLARIVTLVLSRLKETVRVCTRNMTAKLRGPDEYRNEEELSQLQTTKNEAEGFCTWISEELVRNMFPGASCERQITSLELLQCALQTLDGEMLLKSGYVSPVVCRLLLSLTISSWDRCRELASAMVLRLPRPLLLSDDNSSRSEVSGVLKWGLRLVSSVRQREADAGALVLRNIFSSYSLSLGDRVCLHSGTVQVISDGTSKDVVVQQFFDSMLNEINGRVESLRYVYERVQNLILTAHVGGGSPAAATSEILSIEQEPLVADNIICHGWLSALRHCVVEASTSQPSVSSGEAWRNTITKCAMTALSAFRAALIVVAETPSDVAFAPIPYDSDEGNASKGPVNANTYMFTNTNSFVGSVDGGQDDEDGTDDDASNSRSSAMQRAVVSAWLMVKESTALMVHLVELSEKESERKRNIDGVYDRLLAVKDVQEIGASLVDALHRLRHMGAISEAHFGLQSICTCLLRLGERDPQMCELPGQWLRTVLQRLESEEQVFILRRSAGFAYTFLSILRAEPGNCRATLLPEAVHKLLQLGTEDLALYLPSETPMEHDGLSMRWRRCVHALNILRILLLDGTLGTEMDPYISVCCDLAVRGFLSTEWAIRNSAMMLFTAMVQRAIDSEKNDRGVGFHRTATVMEFFASFPSLHGLLLEQLRRQICLGAAEEKSLETVGHSTTSSLFPILLMFSKLRPAFTTAEISAKEHEYPVNEYVAFIMNCLCSRSFHIRQMASQALTSFIPLCSIVGTACDILGNVLTNCQLWSNNAIHGHMLTVNALFNSLYRYRQLVFQQVSGQEADRELVLQPVAELLRGLSSIILRLPTSSNTTPVTVSGAVHGCCPAVMYVYCQILKVLLALSPHHTSLCGLSQQLFDAVIGRTSHPFSVSVTSQLPFIALMWQESLCLGLKHLHRDCEAMIIPQVISLYDSCNVSEVRMGIISGLCETDLLERVALEEASVFFKRLSLLLTRENAKPQLRDLVLSALCRMLTSKCGLTVTIANNECTNELWQWAVHTSRLGMKGIATATTAIAIDTISTPSVQDIAHAIEIMGQLICCKSNHFDSTEFAQILTAYAVDHQPLDLRAAVVKALVTSELMNEILSYTSGQQTNPQTPYLLLLLVLRLLQDDDLEVRKSANLALSQMHRNSASIEHRQPVVESKSMELIAETLLALIRRQCTPPDMEALWQEFTSAVESSCSVDRVLDSLSTTTNAQVHATKKIFTAEQDNIYREVLPHVRVLIDPLCVALLTHPDENTLARLGTLQSNAIKALKVISVTSNTSGQLWIVDGTFREDVFGAEMIWLQTIVHLRKHAAALNKGSLQDEAERLCTEVANLARELIDTLSTTSSQRHVMIDDLLRTLTL